MKQDYLSSSGPVRAVVRPGVTSFEGPIGPENTSGGGGGGGVPLEIGPPGPLLYLGAPFIPRGPG